MAYYRAVKARFEAAVAGEHPWPPTSYPEPVGHCDVCRWDEVCRARRRTDDHLSLVAGIARRTREELVRERGQPVTMLLRGLGGGSSNATCAALDQALIDEASGAVEVRRRTPQRRGGGLDFDSVAGRFSLDDIFGVDHG